MNFHIINCDEKLFLEKYRKDGYLGVRIPIKGTSDQSLKYARRNIYSMYADMKTIFPGDMVFVHANDYIYGVFKAESTFKEDPNVNPMFLSKNIPKLVRTTMENSSLPQIPSDYIQISISHFVDDEGRNLCFEKGFLANEVFDLKRKGKIWSVPERWKYPDSARTIRPLMPMEAQELIKILERENIDTQKRLEITPKDLTNFQDILILNPDIVQYEKIIEGWLCENIPQLQKTFGNITSFGNNIQIGYLKGIDILGITQGTTGIVKYKVIEIKKDMVGIEPIKQTLRYVDWVTEHLCSGNAQSVEGYIVAKDFNKECKDFVRLHNKVNQGRQLHLVQFKYEHPNYVSIQKII